MQQYGAMTMNVPDSRLQLTGDGDGIGHACHVIIILHQHNTVNRRKERRRRYVLRCDGAETLVSAWTARWPTPTLQTHTQRYIWFNMVYDGDTCAYD